MCVTGHLAMDILKQNSLREMTENYQIRTMPVGHRDTQNILKTMNTLNLGETHGRN